MSLAQRLESPMDVPTRLVSPREQGRTSDPVADMDKISQLRRISTAHRDKATGRIPGARIPSILSPSAAEAKKALESRNRSVAISLLDEVSSIIPLLVDENETLRSALKRDRDLYEADVQRTTLIACEWRKSAEAAKFQVDTLERKLAELTERLHGAETQLASEKENAVQSARDAAEAECLSSLFEEKVLSSFGAGSPFQTTLDRIRQRTETDFA